MTRPDEITPDEPYVPEDPDIAETAGPSSVADHGRRRRTNGGAHVARGAKAAQTDGRAHGWRPGMSKPEGCLGFRKGWVEGFMKADEEGKGGKGGRERDRRVDTMVEALAAKLERGEEVTGEDMHALGVLTLLDSTKSWRPAVRAGAARQLIELSNKLKRDDTGKETVDELEKRLKL